MIERLISSNAVQVFVFTQAMDVLQGGDFRKLRKIDFGYFLPFLEIFLSDNSWLVFNISKNVENTREKPKGVGSEIFPILSHCFWHQWRIIK
ncbi:hypothetical protein AB3N62_08265 [Leptospira sp. WS4.C2]